MNIVDIQLIIASTNRKGGQLYIHHNFDFIKYVDGEPIRIPRIFSSEEEIELWCGDENIFMEKIKNNRSYFIPYDIQYHSSGLASISLEDFHNIMESHSCKLCNVEKINGSCSKLGIPISDFDYCSFIE